MAVPIVKTVGLTAGEAQLLDVILRLDLEAIGLSAAQHRIAGNLRRKLAKPPSHGVKAAEGRIGDVRREISFADPFRALRLTPTYRHKDK